MLNAYGMCLTTCIVVIILSMIVFAITKNVWRNTYISTLILFRVADPLANVRDPTGYIMCIITGVDNLLPAALSGLPAPAKYILKYCMP